MDLLLPLRDPGYFQSVRHRLDGGQEGISLACREIDPRNLPKAKHPAGGNYWFIPPEVSSMKSKPVALLLSDLGVTETHKRPHISDNNPFPEAQFKTLKYHPDFPFQFGSIEDARGLCQPFLPGLALNITIVESVYLRLKAFTIIRQKHSSRS